MEFSQADFDRLLIAEHTRKTSKVNYAKDPLDAEDLKAREKELKAKEAELNKREQELRRKEDAIARGSWNCNRGQKLLSEFKFRFGSLSHLECGSCYYSLDQRRRSNNLVSCHYIFHIWAPWWLRNVVSSSLSCYEDMAAKICLSQLPSLVEDHNAEFQVISLAAFEEKAPLKIMSLATFLGKTSLKLMFFSGVFGESTIKGRVL
ncbi:hypothetical protein PVK06_035444 [Gossypium arboreum]|uniref:Uncharacterized protein n=1 Tax=Gossypium arboreum TaxID=29729 RepID=A0ABR0NGT1_GOSAR|nr:hypothetical protein PVK06_035444 [Gossypium arboreum]